MIAECPSLPGCVCPRAKPKKRPLPIFRKRPKPMLVLSEPPEACLVTV